MTKFALYDTDANYIDVIDADDFEGGINAILRKEYVIVDVMTEDRQEWNVVVASREYALGVYNDIFATQDRIYSQDPVVNKIVKKTYHS